MQDKPEQYRRTTSYATASCKYVTVGVTALKNHAFGKLCFLMLHQRFGGTACHNFRALCYPKPGGSLFVQRLLTA
jgi:hypothetical protein